MTLFARLSRLILILAVILSGAGSAVARSEMAGQSALSASGVFVICGGSAEVAFDPLGHPIPSRHACPHCLAAGALAAALDAPSLGWTAAPGPARAAILPDPVPVAARVRVDLPEARGPPVRL